MKSKMTAQELSTLMINKITFITTDKQGKEKKWTTSPDVDHSSLCDGWDVEDFERDHEQAPRISKTENFSAPLALARGQRLQAASLKLQATSRKLDKTELQCYRNIQEKEL